MKYPYSFRTLLVGNSRVLAMDLPEEISLVSTFLFCDVQKNGDWVLTQIDEVLSGKYLNRQIEGNVFRLEIAADYCILHDMLSEEVTACTIETKELEEIIRLWICEHHC